MNMASITNSNYIASLNRLSLINLDIATTRKSFLINNVVAISWVSNNIPTNVTITANSSYWPTMNCMNFTSRVVNWSEIQTIMKIISSAITRVYSKKLSRHKMTFTNWWKRPAPCILWCFLNCSSTYFFKAWITVRWPRMIDLPLINFCLPIVHIE